MTPDQTLAAPQLDPAPLQTEGAAPIDAKKQARIDPRFIAPLFITFILVVAQLFFGVLQSLPQTLLAIAASLATEIILGRLTTGKWPHLASAYVSGISVGILIRSTYFWPYALCGMIAITSKYVIRVKGRHIWNPSNFAIVVMLMLAWEQVATLSQQWDNRIWAMCTIWVVGSLIIWNLKRFHICATYVLSFLAFAAVRGVIEHQSWLVEISPITGPMYQLFIFFMITDPKTTVRSKWGQCAVAFAVAAAEAVLRLNQNIHAPYYALFIVGPIANLIDIWYSSQHQPKVPGASLPAAG